MKQQGGARGEGAAPAPNAPRPSPLPPPTGDVEHRCASCNRRCRACATSAPCARARWCSWCENAYADNAPAERALAGERDGPVLCRSCGAPFPPLAKLIEARLSKYPAYCRACREERRAEAAAERETDARVGADAVVARNGSAPSPRKLPSSSDVRAVPDPEATYQRGGFVPRPAVAHDVAEVIERLAPRGRPPDTTESEMGEGPLAGRSRGPSRVGRARYL